MRIAGRLCAIFIVAGVPSLHAGADQSVSLDAIRKGLRTWPSSTLVLPPVVTSTPPESKRLGILTLVPPDPANGEFVKVVVPIGDLAARVAHRISNARHDRRERKAREAVEADLRRFLSQQR